MHAGVLALVVARVVAVAREAAVAGGAVVEERAPTATGDEESDEGPTCSVMRHDQASGEKNECVYTLDRDAHESRERLTRMTTSSAIHVRRR
jgi:hypothetical protein